MFGVTILPMTNPAIFSDKFFCNSIEKWLAISRITTMRPFQSDFTTLYQFEHTLQRFWHFSRWVRFLRLFLRENVRAVLRFLSAHYQDVLRAVNDQAVPLDPVDCRVCTVCMYAP